MLADTIADQLATPLSDEQLRVLSQHAQVITVRVRLLAELNRSLRSDRHQRIARMRALRAAIAWGQIEADRASEGEAA
jgi:hypothetical protein